MATVASFLAQLAELIK